MILLGYLVGSIAHSESAWTCTATWVIFMIVGRSLSSGHEYMGHQRQPTGGRYHRLFEMTGFLAWHLAHCKKDGGKNTGGSPVNFALSRATRGRGTPRASIYTILAFHRLRGSRLLTWRGGRKPTSTIQIDVLGGILSWSLGCSTFQHLRGGRVFGPARYVSFGAIGGGTPVDPAGSDVWGVGGWWCLRHLETHVFANGTPDRWATTLLVRHGQDRVSACTWRGIEPAGGIEYVGVWFQVVVTARHRCPSPSTLADTASSSGHHPGRHACRHLRGVFELSWTPANISAKAPRGVQPSPARGDPGARIAGVHPGRAHRAGHGFELPEVRHAASDTGPKRVDWQVVSHRPGRHGLTVSQDPERLPGDEDGLRRRVRTSRYLEPGGRPERRQRARLAVLR